VEAKVAKQFSFHAAHRLPNHDGQCRRLHGHTYVLEIAVIGPVKQDGGSDEGMVLDFTVLKDIYKMEIEPQVEHQYLNESLKGPIAGGTYPFWSAADASEPLTTCECLASWIWGVVSTRIRDLDSRPPSSQPEMKVKIKLWETPTSFAVIG
jgi:queuosine biosynthesis protein QueD